MKTAETKSREQAAMRARHTHVKIGQSKPLNTIHTPRLVPVLPPKEICQYGRNQSGVYLIGSSALGWFKIGQSQDIMGRLGCYRSYPFRIDMKQVWSVEDTRCREMEKVLHALVESKRIRANGGYSEWFNLDILDIHVIRETMKTFVCISLTLR